MDDIVSSTEAYEQALRELDANAHYVLRLYVAGSGARSLQAVARVRQLCEAHLKGRYDLEVIDIYLDPASAQPGDVICAPTLIKEVPPPTRRIVGSMNDEGQLLIALGVRRDP